MSAAEVCDALREGIRAADSGVQVVSVPLADGGEGTVDALVHATEGEFIDVDVEGPLGDSVTATFGILGDGQTAVIEMAAASGLPLVPPQLRDPLHTTTYGTGQLIEAALQRGCRQLIVGIGGSATNDGGAAMAQALGARMLDEDGQLIPRVSGGRLRDIADIDISGLDSRLGDCQVRVACDVDNPLYGPQGAAYTYAPQKGATPAQVEALDAGLCHYAQVLEAALGKSVAEIPGAGAAGGLGAGLLAFADASLESGVEIVAEVVGLREKAAGADLIITGEGRIDWQTAFGKAPSAAAKLGRELNIPVIGIGGSVEPEAAELYEHGFTALFSCVNEPMSLTEAMEPAVARRLLRFTARQITQLLVAACETMAMMGC